MKKIFGCECLKIDRWLPEALRKKAAVLLLTTLVWLAVITLLRWNWQLSFRFQIAGILFFWLGGILGTFLLDLDHLVYLLFIYPQELTSLRVKKLLEEKRIGEMLDLVAATSGERIRLPFHNALFQPVLYVLCFFVLTSTASLFGAGLVMAMALRLLRDEVKYLLQSKEEALRRWLFWQCKAEVSLNAQKFFVILMLLVFAGLNLFLI